MTVRRAISDFDLGNPFYAGATVTAYTTTVAGARTATKATLYAGMTGTATLGNPQRLDGEGKWKQPVYIDAPVIIRITGTRAEDHDTAVIGARGTWRGNWATGRTYYATDFVFAPASAGSAGNRLYTAADDYTSGASVAADVTAGSLVEVVDIGDFLAGQVVETILSGNGTTGPYGPLNSAAPSGATLLVVAAGTIKNATQFSISADGLYLTFTSTVASGTDNILVKTLAATGNVLVPADGTITPRMLRSPFDLGSVAETPPDPGAGVPGTGTVTSISTIDGLTGGPITGSGSIGIAVTGVTANTYGTAAAVPAVTVNSRGQITAAANVAITPGAIGAQPVDATLTAWGGVIFSADTMGYATASDTFATTTLTSFARTLLDDTTATAARATLGAVIGTDVQAYDATTAALAALDGTAGLLEQTGADTFVKRALGVGASTSVPTRADADARYLLLSGGTLTGDLDFAAGNRVIGAAVGANSLTLGGSSTGVQIPGSLTLTGNLTVNGTTTTVHSTTVTTDDNTIVLNNAEVGAGVTAGTAGIEIERGSLTNYQFVFRESDDAFVIGAVGSLQAVATREDSPTNAYFARWNSSSVRFDAVSPATVLSDIGAAATTHYHEEVFVVAASDETTNLTTGTAKITFYAPFTGSISAAPWLGVSAQSTSGVVTADLNKAGTTVFTTNPSIDANEDNSLTGTASVLNGAQTFTKGDKFTIDIDAAGTGAKGLKMFIPLTRSA